MTFNLKLLQLTGWLISAYFSTLAELQPTWTTAVLVLHSTHHFCIDVILRFAFYLLRFSLYKTIFNCRRPNSAPAKRSLSKILHLVPPAPNTILVKSTVMIFKNKWRSSCTLYGTPRQFPNFSSSSTSTLHNYPTWRSWVQYQIPKKDPHPLQLSSFATTQHNYTGRNVDCDLLGKNFHCVKAELYT